MAWWGRPADRSRVGGTPMSAADTITSTAPTSTAPTSTAPAPEREGWEAPSWEQVVREHSARVYRLAYRLSGNQQDAEDL
ncbi:RNA polymerase sigma factor SigE, partial [Modestobacter sp. NPDC013298]